VTASAYQLGISRATLYRLLARPSFMPVQDMLDKAGNESAAAEQKISTRRSSFRIPAKKTETIPTRDYLSTTKM
jgi:hypothetical protein